MKKWSLFIGSYAGIKIFVHWTFWIIVGWIFMMHFEMGHGWTEGIKGAFFIIVLFACVVLHEFGHALGLTHEHNRDDTPEACTKSQQGTKGDTTVGTWDAQSVMNYCNETYANGGQLSEGDIETIRTAYRQVIQRASRRRSIAFY